MVKVLIRFNDYSEMELSVPEYWTTSEIFGYVKYEVLSETDDRFPVDLIVI